MKINILLYLIIGAILSSIYVLHSQESTQSKNSTSKRVWEFPPEVYEEHFKKMKDSVMYKHIDDSLKMHFKMCKIEDDSIESDYIGMTLIKSIPCNHALALWEVKSLDDELVLDSLKKKVLMVISPQDTIYEIYDDDAFLALAYKDTNTSNISWEFKEKLKLMNANKGDKILLPYLGGLTNFREFNLPDRSTKIGLDSRFIIYLLKYGTHSVLPAQFVYKTRGNPGKAPHGYSMGFLTSSIDEKVILWTVTW